MCQLQASKVDQMFCNTRYLSEKSLLPFTLLLLRRLYKMGIKNSWQRSSLKCETRRRRSQALYTLRRRHVIEDNFQLFQMCVYDSIDVNIEEGLWASTWYSRLAELPVLVLAAPRCRKQGPEDSCCDGQPAVPSCCSARQLVAGGQLSDIVWPVPVWPTTTSQHQVVSSRCQVRTRKYLNTRKYLHPRVPLRPVL